jgi:peptide/nickel transport system permease protein
VAVGVETVSFAHAAPSEETSLLRIARRYAESRIAVAALAVMVVIILIAVFAPLISPQNPYDLAEIDLQEGRLLPGAAKLSKAAKIGVVAMVRGLRSVPEPSLTLSPMDRGGDAPVGALTIALAPGPEGGRTFALKFAALPMGPLDPLATVQIRELPRGSTLSAGQKSKFRNVWKIDAADLAGLVLTLPTAAADEFRFDITATGGPRHRLMTYWLGTDDQGRDMMSAIFYGLRISLAVAFTSVLIALTIGTLVGLYAAYHGGRIDSLIMRLVDLQLSFPTILVALILLALLGKGVVNVMLALVIVQWALYARMARGVALAERRKEYIEAAQCLGLSTRRVILAHILPNCLPSLIVVATLEVAHAVSLEATLSFLGVGLPVTEPSLGLLISNGFDFLLSGYPWISVLPGVALLITVISINLVGDELRDILNPRLQQ